VRRRSKAGGKSPNAQASKAAARKSRYSGDFARHQLVARRLAAGIQGDLGECNAHLRVKFGNLWLREVDKFRIVAIHGGSAEYREYLFAEPVVALDARNALSRVVSHREVIQIDDISKVPTYGVRMRIATIKIAKARTLVWVPMLKDDEVVGIIAIYRQEVRPFNDKQIELVQNFAAHASVSLVVVGSSGVVLNASIPPCGSSNPATPASQCGLPTRPPRYRERRAIPGHFSRGASSPRTRLQEIVGRLARNLRL
jgi:hypothetical protein